MRWSISIFHLMKRASFARRRLVFDEFFMFLVGVRRLKEHREKEMSSWGLKECPEILKLRERLPYALTGAQERTLKEVFSDMAGGRVMNRLIQGDVGSGKTIIAILALLQAAYNGCQELLWYLRRCLPDSILNPCKAVYGKWN